MPWLVRDGAVLASVETAATRRQRRRGLRGRDGVDGVLMLRARSVHTVGMRFPIDVALCRPQRGDRLRVLRVMTVRRNRVTRLRVRSTVALEAEAGSFRRWGVTPGDVLEIR
jgi:uncharacterized membrane protein (UPF0127 family)